MNHQPAGDVIVLTDDHVEYSMTMIYEVLAAPEEYIPWLLAGLSVYLAGFLFPAIYAAYAAMRHRGTLPRPILFVGVVTGQSYGYTFLMFSAIGLPLEVFSVFVGPRLATLGHLHGSWLMSIAEFLEQWWLLLVPISLIAWSLGVATYLKPRWSRIVDVLDG